MRVVGGKVKGRALKGAVVAGVRPTTERARAAIFNILDPSVYEGQRVLDLYAGTGSLGIEALSRGAAWADFVERNPRQAAIIRENLAATGLAGAARVVIAAAETALASLPGGYSLVLLDPPYRMLEEVAAILCQIDATPGLALEGAVVVVGYSRHVELLPQYGSLRRIDHRRYGDNVVDFYLKEKEAANGDGPVPGEL